MRLLSLYVFHPDSYSCTMEFKFKRKPNPGTARSRRESFVPRVRVQLQNKSGFCEYMQDDKDRVG